MFLRTIVSPRRLGGPSTFRFTRGVVPRVTADDRPRFPIVIRVVVVALTVVVARIVVIVVIIESNQTKRRKETSNRKLKIPENRIVGVSARVEAKRSVRAFARPSARCFPRIADPSVAVWRERTRPIRTIDLNHHRSESPGHAREPRKTRRRDRAWFLLEARADRYLSYLYTVWIHSIEALIPPVPVDQWVDALTRCSRNTLK